MDHLKNSTLAPVEYRFHFNEQEREAFGLMKYYEFLRRKICNDSSYMVCSRQKDPRESRFFKNFQDLLNQKDIIPNPKVYITAQFEMLKMEMRGQTEIECPPSYLFSQYAWSRYKNYINGKYLEENKTENDKITIEEVINEMNQTHKFIKKYNLNIFGKNEFNFRKFISDPNNWIFIIHKKISPYFLAISRTFSYIDLKKAPKQFTCELPKNLDIYKSVIFNNDKLFETARNLFGDEINER